MKKNVAFYNFASYYNRIQNKNPSITDTILSGLSGSNTPPPGGMMTLPKIETARLCIAYGCEMIFCGDVIFKKEVLREKISALFVGLKYDF